jgi:hypothetical protein
VSVYGGSTTAQWTRQGDEYYGMEKFVTPQGVTQWLLPGSPNYNTYYNYNDNINANIVVYTPYQLAGFHTIWGGGTEIFDRERVSVDLWNYALGSYRQSFNWVPGQGIVQQFIWQGTDFSNYLNIDSTFNQQQHGGLLHADDLTPPTLVGPDGTYAGLTCAALNGSPGAGPWLQRRAVESTMTYNDPLFLRYAYADQGAPPSTFGQYIAGNTAAPTNATWMTATMDCDVTIRTDSMRYAAGEGSQTSDTLLTQVLGVLGAQYQPPQWSQVEKPLLALPTVNGKWEPN